MVLNVNFRILVPEKGFGFYCRSNQSVNHIPLWAFSWAYRIVNTPPQRSDHPAEPKPDGVFFMKTSLVADGQLARAVRGTLSVAPTALYAAGAK